MRVIKNLKYLLQTALWFLVIFGGITLVVLLFLYANPGGNQEERTFRMEPKSEPITLDEYRTLLDPDRPDPRHAEYRYAQSPKQASRN